MKLLNQQIDMISWTSKEGIVTPIRFRMEKNGAPVVIKINHIFQTEKNLFGGIPILTFRCSSMIHHTEKIYELTYNCKNQQWLLKKM